MTDSTASDTPYPAIGDYAFISDCHCTALVSRAGSIDWCCMPRVDSDSCFGRLLDWQRGGYCSVSAINHGITTKRRYLTGTMVLETCLQCADGEARLLDFFVINEAECATARYELVRIIEGISGSVSFCTEIRPRFDYGEIMPRMYRHAPGAWTTIGSIKGLVIYSDIDFDLVDHRDLTATVSVTAGERCRLMIHYDSPERIGTVSALQALDDEIDRGFVCTCRWWRNWSQQIHSNYAFDAQTVRSSMVLKGLTFERTGAIIAAPTTSLPEWIGASRNWDYRFSWVRDSVFTVRALYELGYKNEAERFLEFIQRSSAGSAEQLQIMYAVDGKRRLTEHQLEWLEGYRQSAPVRIGNFAAKQRQLDIYSEILEIATLWDQSGHSIDPEYWDFLNDVVEMACKNWQVQDYGIWEFRGGPNHYVHSKAMCWRALDQGITLALSKNFPAPLERWNSIRNDIRHAIEQHGYDHKRGIFVQSFDTDYLDASLLLLPYIGFVAYDDPRMLRTTDAICGGLDRRGLLARYDSWDGLPGNEGCFLPCTFWLVNCLAHQGRLDMPGRTINVRLAALITLACFRRNTIWNIAKCSAIFRRA